jgi:hypothetical protein
MSDAVVCPRIVLRIPGDWNHPGELLERLPTGFRLTPEALWLPDGTEIDFTPMAPDAEFARVFQEACRRPPKDDERAALCRYRVNVVLSGAGGSLESARTMMQAGAAVVRAGAAGVFIDNSALAHGGADWIAMADDGGPTRSASRLRQLFAARRRSTRWVCRRWSSRTW